jgi:hypothetical protein
MKKWKDTYYYVTEDGKVFSKAWGKTKELKLYTRPKQGYVTCTAGYVHRLVAETYLHNPMDKVEVNHKDGNKANNHISNLPILSDSTPNSCSEPAVTATAPAIPSKPFTKASVFC